MASRTSRSFDQTSDSSKHNLITKKQEVAANCRNYDGDWIEKEIRIVLLGKTGSGKSATGNMILGERMFKSTVSGSSVTNKCSKKHISRFDRKILVVDTPGIFDTRQSNKNIQDEIAKCIGITAPGPHAFILVLSITRYTEEEHNSVMHFVKHFGEDIFRYFIVLFTRKDDLVEEGRSLFEHMKTLPPNLLDFIQKSGGRVTAFNNRLKGEEGDSQVRELLSMISENVERNDGKHYTNKMYRDAEKLIREREEAELKMAKEQREKEIKQIEKKISEKYKASFAKEQQKLNQTESQLRDMAIQNQQDKEESRYLREQIKELNRKVEEDTNARNAAKIKEYERRVQQLEREREREENKWREYMKREREEEKERMTQEVNEIYRRAEESARDKCRDEIEEEKGFFSSCIIL